MNISTIEEFRRLEASIARPIFEMASRLEMATIKMLEAERNVTLEMIVKTCLAILIPKDKLHKGLVVLSEDEDRQESDGGDGEEEIVLSKHFEFQLAFSQAVIDVAGEHNLFDISEKRLVRAVCEVLEMFKQEGKVLRDSGEEQTIETEAKSAILPSAGLSIPSEDAGVKPNLKSSAAQEDPGTGLESKKLAETTDEDNQSPSKAPEYEVSQN